MLTTEIAKDLIYYIATPYSHPDPFEREDRATKAAFACYTFMKHDLVAYSPIVHCHPIALKNDLPKDWDYWQRFDTKMISVSDVVVLILFRGWQKSKGMWDEALIANRMKKKVSVFTEQDLFALASIEDIVNCINLRCMVSASAIEHFPLTFLETLENTC